MIRIRAAIVDDEPIARDRLRRLLGAESEVDVVGEYSNGQEMIAGLKDINADVVFLDVTMPEMDGFEALARLPAPPPLVVFVTAHSDFAVRAFSVEAFDYLLKPTSGPRLRSTLERIRRTAERRGQTYSDKIALPVGGRVYLLNVGDINYVKAHENYITIGTEGRDYTLRRTLAWIEERLDTQHFIRVHRSYILRIDAVRDITPLRSGRFSIRINGNLLIPTGRSYCEEVRRRFRLRTTYLR